MREPTIYVDVGGGPVRFTTPFRIGRSTECEVRVDNDYVSRVHARVDFSDGAWHVVDLDSSNGVFHKADRIASLRIDKDEVVRLGVRGPEIRFQLPPRVGGADTASGDPAELDQYIGRYFGEKDPQGAGERTVFIRRAFASVQQQQHKRYRRYRIAIGLLAIALALSGGYALYAYRKIKAQEARADQIFTAIKTLDIAFANARAQRANSGPGAAEQDIAEYHRRRATLVQEYERFVKALDTYNQRLSEQDRLILRMARVFGECETSMPPGFPAEVGRYIGMWRSSGRYERGIRTALANRYNGWIPREFLARGLPPQFFYLAMQESDFDPHAVGPLTYKGYAKGMWQFIPETAAQYGLRLGPLVDVSRPDPGDERNNVEAATRAAADYIRDLYRTEAQGSGLLVMACYNWGEKRVLPLVQSLPADPRTRNFWRLLGKYKDRLPPETYNYVFYIFSAAVIGENPRLFGFDFDNPLESN